MGSLVLLPQGAAFPLSPKGDSPHAEHSVAVATVLAAREQFAQPFAVTAHAVSQYRARVDPNASRDEAIAELQRALQAPAFSRPVRDGATLYGCRDRCERRIGIVVAPPPAEGDRPVVVTCGPWLLWHEFRTDWEEMYREWARARGLPEREPGQPTPPATRSVRTTTKQKRREDGLCVGCGKRPPDAGWLTCAECRARCARAMRELRARRRAAGKCPRCGRALDGSVRRCAACRAADTRRTSASYRAVRPPTPYRQNQVDFISRYIGLRSLEWIAERLRVSVRTVRNIRDAEGLGPTTRGDLLTTGQVSELLGRSQQWVSHLCRTGQMRGRRNPSGDGTHHRWWLVDRAEVQRWLAREGKPVPAWLDEPTGWPGLVPRRPGRRKAARVTLPEWASRRASDQTLTCP